MIVSVVVTLTPVSVAVIVTTVVDFTSVYVTGNVADFDPTGMLTVAGTETTDGFELVSCTADAPPKLKIRLSVTVPVTVVWDDPTTVEGEIVTLCRVGAVMATVTVRDTAW